MNRLHKKCFVASAGFHVLLMVILFVGPAFLSSKQEPPPEVIDFVPSVLLDGLVPAGGGNPNAAPPPAQPVQPAPAPAPAPAPQPEPEPEPEPPKPAPKAKAPEPEPVKTPPEVNQDRVDPDAIAEAKPKKPAVSLKVHTAKNSSRSKAAAEAKAAQQRAAAAEQAARAAVAKRLANAASGIRSGTGSATTVEDYGPGGGGPSYASYISEVQRIYRDAWAPPEDTANDDAITKATIVIASDGRVVSARITRASGDAQVDNSVKFTLDRVKFIAPFPEGAKDKQRTYIINFNLKVKRGLA